MIVVIPEGSLRGVVMKILLRLHIDAGKSIDALQVLALSR